MLPLAIDMLIELLLFIVHFIYLLLIIIIWWIFFKKKHLKPKPDLNWFHLDIFPTKIWPNEYLPSRNMLFEVVSQRLVELRLPTFLQGARRLSAKSSALCASRRFRRACANRIVVWLLSTIRHTFYTNNNVPVLGSKISAGAAAENASTERESESNKPILLQALEQPRLATLTAAKRNQTRLHYS